MQGSHLSLFYMLINIIHCSALNNTFYNDCLGSVLLACLMVFPCFQCIVQYGTSQIKRCNIKPRNKYSLAWPSFNFLKNPIALMVNRGMH